MFTTPIAAIATRATMMMYSVNPCPLRFEALSLAFILVFLLCLGICRQGGARGVPVFFRERRAEYPEEIREDVEKEVRSKGGTDSEGVRISDRWFDDRSYYGMRIADFFSFSNRGGLGVPRSRAVRARRDPPPGGRKVPGPLDSRGTRHPRESTSQSGEYPRACPAREAPK